jgi:electron transport complex protein RnfG
MREFLKIAANLVAICLVAAGLLGVVFIHTEAARVRNEEARLAASMRRYLPPDSDKVAFSPIHRYLVEREGKEPGVGYLLPTKAGHALLVLDPEGRVTDAAGLKGPVEGAAEREEALAHALPGAKVRFADTYILALAPDGRRLASFISGRTTGFKTWVKLLVALGPDNGVLGLEVLEHEEDPGLGAEIEQEYFRNQFAGRTLQELARLGVVKLPLPDDYRRCLERSRWAERGLDPTREQEMCAKFGNEQIHAITGATISSRRVTEGVQRLAGAFVKRMDMVQAAAAQAGLEPAF